MSQKGFTLIELLVVIAIIGVLSSVVLASLSSARLRSRDAAVKNNLKTVQLQAEIYFPEYERYASVTGAYYEGNCLTNSTMFREQTITGPARDAAEVVELAIDSAWQANGQMGKQCRISGTRLQYMVAIELRNETGYWCVDNLGFSGRIAALPTTGTVACN